MRCALAAVGFINGNIEYNKNTIIEVMTRFSGTVDIVIFGEAFLQGFYGADFREEHDSRIALGKDSQIIREICSAAENHSVAVSFGFIEKEMGKYYSSQITIDKNGAVIDLYRRVSPGWKEKFANENYREGSCFHSFAFEKKRVTIGLCGDLWEDENIKEIKSLDPDVIWWPSYTDYNYNEWNRTIKYEYAEQAGKLERPVLYVNSLCNDKANETEIAKGGAAYYSGVAIMQEIASGTEDILIVEC